MNNDFKIILEAMIDNSSLSNVQKQLAKERLKINADISVEDFAKSKQAIEKQIASLAQGIKTILGNAVTDKQASQWAKQYYDGMISGAKEAAKAQESLTNAMAKGREQAEQSRQAEQKRQQMAQNNAINKALEQEYQERQKNIEATKKQAELDKQNALAFTKSASKKLSSAISKYSYGDTSDANAMMKQMNRGLSNFGDLSNVQGNIAQISSTVDKIIADLKVSHEQSLQALNEEIKAEQALQSQKDSFNKKNINAIDYEIQKREEEAKAFSSMLQAQMQEQQKMQSEVNKIQHSLDVGDYEAQIETVKKGFVTLSGNADEAENHVKRLRDALKSMHDATDDNAKILAEKNYRLELEKTQNQLTISKAKAKEYVDVLKVNKLRNDIQDWLKKNTAATKEARDAMQSYLNMLNGDKISPIDFNTAKDGMDYWNTEMRKMGKLGKSLTETFKQGAKSFLEWTTASGAVMEVVTSIRQGVSELKELDNILTEISKTSDLTSKQLDKLGDSAFESASKYGKTASDYLTGVQEMYRAGFDNAEEMAELSVLAQSAGDMETDSANDYLMATNAAYKYKGSVEELNKVLDSQNYITNNAAISMQDIADATTETASVAAQYGVQINELSALIATATANTRESGSEVGTALKAILINLQDITSKPVTDTMDKLGISMFKVVDGAERLKTPIELIYELADAYNSLPEGHADRALILNEIGQKRHANTLASILSDMESYHSMLDLYNNSSAENSAFREAQKSAENWSGTWNKVKNSWSDLLQNFANTDTIVGALNILNDLIGTLDKLGAMGTIGLGAGLFAGIKNVGEGKMHPSICFE